MTGNDNEPLGVETEVIEVRDAPGEWLVESIDHGSDGEIYRAIFQGPLARERALKYAGVEYGHNGIVMPPVTVRGLPTQRPKPVLSLVSPQTTPPTPGDKTREDPK